MKLHFHKMQGLGNDFVVIDSSNLKYSITPEGIRFLCNRKLGIGCDTLVFYRKSEDQIDASFFNADGSEAEICINATRCLASFMYDQNKLSSLSIITKTKTYETKISNDSIFVNIGKPSFSHKAIGITDESIDLTDLLKYLKLSKSETSYFSRACALSVGNPHLIMFLKQDYSKSLTHALKQSIGERLEKLPLFKNRINVSFANVTNNTEIDLEVFERGVGFTLACGSGASATAFMAHKLNLTGNKIRVKQPGGNLEIFIKEDNSIVHKGLATHVFEGTIDLKDPSFFTYDNISTNIENKTEESNLSTEITEQSHQFQSNTKIQLQNKKPNIYQIYTDGACSGNPGPGGWGAVIIKEGEHINLSGGENLTTNNKMELTAPIMALKEIPDGSTVELYTDSNYVKQGITKWIKGWERNGWITSSKEPVKNKELWMELNKQSKLHKIKWIWVKGHNGDFFNEMADNLARSSVPKE